MKEFDVLIKKYLKKKKETPILEVSLRNYEKENIYIGLVYNEKICEYKVLYVPINKLDSNDVSEYVCYQFVDRMVANYITNLFVSNKVNYLFAVNRDLHNRQIDNYHINICFYKGREEFKFRATEFIPFEWIFMFDAIVTLFEYCPNAISEYLEKILTLFKNKNAYIPYQESFDFELLRDEEKVLNDKIKGNKLNYNLISRLEEVDGKYFAIIDKHLVIIKSSNGVVSSYADCDDYNDYLYTVIMAIRDDVCKKFSRICIRNKNLGKFFLCYGMIGEKYKVIKGHMLDKISDDNIEVVYNHDNELDTKK